MLQTTMMSMARRAIHQLLLQLCMALPERQRPIAIIIGPVTTGGKNFITRAGPNTLKRAATTKYIKPAKNTPMQAYGRACASVIPFAMPICVTVA